MKLNTKAGPDPERPVTASMADSLDSSIRRPNFSNIAKITNFVFNFPTLSVDIHTSSHYGQIKAALKKKGTPIPENDIWIAALVRQHEAILVTNDNHFQLIPNLTVLSY